MVKRMLIEATHPEETRVVVLDGTRLEEFDVETSTKKQIKGNIYLAKVVRVEPSLQAAFVDYGGNRHGFLAFSEIHPDYYQIPVADRERLMAEAQRHEEEEERKDRARDSRREAQQGQAPSPDQDQNHDHAPEHDHDHHRAATLGPDHNNPDQPSGGFDPEHSLEPIQAPGGHESGNNHDAHDHEGGDAIPLAFIPPAITSPYSASDDDLHEGGAHSPSETPSYEPRTDAPSGEPGPEAPSTLADFTGADAQAPASDVTPADTAGTPTGETSSLGERPGGESAPEQKSEDKAAGVETVGGEEDEEEAAEDKQRRRFLASRHYKIQEVIKRRQIMLIQVVKEERGNKGAALTTFLSLAGRYCVLMPNSPRGGGVSRKITSAQDRRRLKAILGDLELPQAMAVILRTAGAERNKAEIKRDYEYLQRTWNNIREVTMSSRAPALIHEEASLIKRAIRDIYSRDIEELWVEGEEGYKIAKDFMKMLTPSHAKKVQRYKDDIIPLFHRYQVESQMEAINSPVVQLRSGGSIVFAQTEALVAIDVNSGRATKERHIEETAFKTNMEAADEIARQLRLRDLAGLIVIDFIDMEEGRNNHGVERRLKEALKADRARIQVGRISHFGLLELSRQRLRPSLIEANFRPCAHCAGSGMVRSTESAAVYSLRMLEEEGVRQRSSEVTITVHPDVALYLLNYKRDSLADIESRYRLKILVLGDATLVPPNIRLDRVKAIRAPGEDGEAHPETTHREIARPAMVAPEIEEEEEAEPESPQSESHRPEPRAQEPRPHQARPPREHGRDAGGRNAGGRDAGGRDASGRDDGPREEGGGRKRKRRRRRGGANRNADGSPISGGEYGAAPGGAPIAAHGSQESSGESQDAGTIGESENQGYQNTVPGEPRPNLGPDDPARRGRRRGRRGGRRRRRGGEPGSEQANASGGENQSGDTFNAPGENNDAPHYSSAPGSDATRSHGYEDGGSTDVAASPHANPPERTNGEDAPSGPSDRGPSRFFRALKEGAMSWRRGETPSGDAAPVAEPRMKVPPPSPAPRPQPSPPPQVSAAPPPVLQPSRVESSPPDPSGPVRRGWWQEPKE